MGVGRILMKGGIVSAYGKIYAQGTIEAGELIVVPVSTSEAACSLRTCSTCCVVLRYLSNHFLFRSQARPFNF